MSGSDALLWTISADPVMRPTIVAIVVLDARPDWAEVRTRIAALTVAVPRLRSRAVTRALGRGRPQFVPDESFDLDTHLRRMRLAGHRRPAGRPRHGPDDGDERVRRRPAAVGGRPGRRYG